MNTGWRAEENTNARVVVVIFWSGTSGKQIRDATIKTNSASQIGYHECIIILFSAHSAASSEPPPFVGFSLAVSLE